MQRAFASLALVAGLVLVTSCTTEKTREPPTGPDELGRASSALLAPAVTGVYLGMKPSELQKARPRATRQSAADEPGTFVYDEALPGHARAVYVFSELALRLLKVQLASVLPSVNDIAPRVAAQQSRFGVASGIWDCPVQGQSLPTRRFSWTRGLAGVMDTYLILGNRVAATLYVAPRHVILDSLAQANCAPTPEGRITQFPVPQPSPAQVSEDQPTPTPQGAK